MKRNFKIVAHTCKMQQEDRAEEEFWRHSSLQSRMLHLLRSGLHSDCQFLVGTEECNKKLFHCHKLIMCSTSEVFESMLYGQFSEASTSEPIKIEDVTPKDFEIFVKFAYGALEYSVMKWPAIKSLLKLGSKYMADGFVQRYANLAYELWLNCDETLDFYEFQFDIDKSLLHGKEWHKQLTRMIERESWLKSERLFSMSIEAFTNFMHLLFDHISAITKYDTIKEYVDRLQPNDHQLMKAPRNDDITFAQYKRELFRGLLQYINFDNMTPQEFAQGPGTSDVLSDSEKYEMLSKLTIKYHGPARISNPTNYSENYDNDYDKYYDNNDIDIEDDDDDDDDDDD